jgi:hypothetical protein
MWGSPNSKVHGLPFPMNQCRSTFLLGLFVLWSLGLQVQLILFYPGEESFLARSEMEGHLEKKNFLDDFLVKHAT